MNFLDAVTLIIEIEGGYVNDPQDPGGETHLGISKRSYPHLNIREITLDQAREIYRQDFWMKLRCSDLPRLLRLTVFDCAVNQGQPTAATLLQRIVGAVQDGVVGPKTLRAISQYDQGLLFRAFQIERLKRYAEDPKVERFGRSWFRRTLVIHERAIRDGMLGG